MRRLLAAVLLGLAVAACGAEEDEPEPVAAPLAEVLEVRCLADGTTLATPQVQPGRAGVRVRVVNETDGARIVGLNAGRLRVTAAQEPGTTSESTETLRPGAVDVECVSPDGGAQGTSGVVRVEVVDPDGLWQPDTPECPADDLVGIPAETGWTAYPPLSQEHLPDQLRQRAQLAPEDEVRPGGYPEQADAPLVAVRDGRVIVSATPARQEGGGWDFAEVWVCASDGLVQPEAMPPREAVASESAEATSAVDPQAPLPDVVEVRCTADGTTVSAPQVKPGTAGVRMRVVNDADGLRVLTVQSTHGVRGDGHEAGTTRESAEDLAPGPVDVACYDPQDPAEDPPSSPGYLERVAHFEVVDADGVWVRDTLQCTDDGGFGMAGSFGPDAGGPREELPAMLRSSLKLRATDEVRPAGYPERPNGPLVVVRDGRVIARGTVAEFPSGWVIDSVEGCGGEGIEP